MILEIFYDQVDTGDGHAEPEPIKIATKEELDALVTRIRAETAANDCPPMIEVALADTQLYPLMYVGLGRDQGFVHYIADADDEGWTCGDTARNGNVAYTYTGSWTEIPARAEVPIDDVLTALNQFFETGRRPAVVP